MWNVKAFCCIIWQWWFEGLTAKQCTHKIKSTAGTIRYTRDRLVRALNLYSQLSPCGHPAITDTPIKRTVAKSPAKKKITDVWLKKNSRYYGLSLMRKRVEAPTYTVSAIKGVECNSEAPSSSLALTACWICSWQSRVQILGHACK